MPKAVAEAFYMRSRHDDIVRPTQQWAKWFQSEFACPAGSHFGQRWRSQPISMDVELVEEARGSVASVFRAPLRLVRRDLFDFLDSHLKGFLAGAASVRQPGAAPLASKYVTVAVPPLKVIDPYRGTAAQHRQCAGCGRFRSVSFDDHAMGITARELDGNDLYGDDDGSLYVTSPLVKRLGREKAFADLRFVYWPVISQPLDGDVLPGDLEWTGTFAPQEHKLRGRI